jgi:serine protease AprX
MKKVLKLASQAAIPFLILPMLCFSQGQSGSNDGESTKQLSPDLDDYVRANAANPSAIQDVIVQFCAPPTPSEIGALNAAANAANGNASGNPNLNPGPPQPLPGVPDLSLINAQFYTLSAPAIAAIVANDPNIKYVTRDRPVQPTLDYADAATGAQTALSYGWNGTGVGVAVIDSGILMPAPDLQDPIAKATSRVLYSQSFVAKVTSTADQYGHGTHVAGIIAGNGASSTGPAYFKTFRGMAPNAKLINLRVLDQNGAGTDSGVIAAINWAVQNKSRYNIRVINLSLGRPVFESYTLDPLCLAVEKAWNAGIVVVVAAGNQGRNNSQGTMGYATVTAPGNNPSVITVGGMKTMFTPSRLDDLIASYSSKGPTLVDHVVKPDLVAPGNKTVSLLASKTLVVSKSGSVNLIPYNYYQNTTNTSASANYYRLSGTSMAAPMVSGTVALMLQKDPALSPETIKERLMKSATKSFPQYSTAVDPVTNASYTSQYDMFTIGAGYLDTWGALNCTDTIPAGSNASSPTAVFDPATNNVTVVNATNTVLGTHAVWGSTDLFGTAAVWGTGVFVDGAAAVWGTGTLWGAHAVWGTGDPTGSAAVWGTHAVWGSSTNDSGETLSLLINGEN